MLEEEESVSLIPSARQEGVFSFLSLSVFLMLV